MTKLPLLKIILCLVCLFVGGCFRHLPPLEKAPVAQLSELQYHIGPGDSVQIFVWRNPEFSMTIPVRPDGKISIPLVEDVIAANKTPTQLANDMEQALSYYIKDPVVTVMVNQFSGIYSDNIRVVGEASQPQAIPYRAGMSLLDVMILVGGLTQYADGNRSTLVRVYSGRSQSYRARLDDLLRDGDIKANAPVLPGDILIIPEAYF